MLCALLVQVNANRLLLVEGYSLECSDRELCVVSYKVIVSISILYSSFMNKCIVFLVLTSRAL